MHNYRPGDVIRITWPGHDAWLGHKAVVLKYMSKSRSYKDKVWLVRNLKNGLEDEFSEYWMERIANEVFIEEA